MRGQPKHYRELAARSRELAQAIRDEDAKAHLLDVARQYEKLADEEEALGGRAEMRGQPGD